MVLEDGLYTITVEVIRGLTGGVMRSYTKSFEAKDQGAPVAQVDY